MSGLMYVRARQPVYFDFRKAELIKCVLRDVFIRAHKKGVCITGERAKKSVEKMSERISLKSDQTFDGVIRACDWSGFYVGDWYKFSEASKSSSLAYVKRSNYYRTQTEAVSDIFQAVLDRALSFGLSVPAERAKRLLIRICRHYPHPNILNGFLRGIKWDGVYDGSELFFDKATEYRDKNIIARRKAELDRQAPYIGRMLMVYYEDLQSKKYSERKDLITFFTSCENCGDTYPLKNLKRHSGFCQRCATRYYHLERRECELAEVNRLTNKLKKVIRNESKRLTQEAAQCN